MSFSVNNCNHPCWRDISVQSRMPESLLPLDEISKNLWWVWNNEAVKLFRDISPESWDESQKNPVSMLHNLSKNRLSEIEQNQDLMNRIQQVYKNFRSYMDAPKNDQVPSVAYFSMEYGLAACLKIYSGGLGVLAGDYLKEASDCNINLTAVGFLYRYGYFTQTLSMDGQQLANYEAQDFNQIPVDQVVDDKGQPVILEVPFAGHTVYANIWKANVGRVTLYLMDTDVDANSEYDRSITYQLYGGDWENRMKQEYMLGVGGILLLEKLGIKKDIYHCNEGHAALINAQRLANYIQNESLTYVQALEVVRATSLYTVHTPVPAGHDSFDEGLFGKYMGHFPEKLGISWQEFIDMGRENPGTAEKFSMSVFACNTCQEVNGVSWLHGEVSKKMFQPIWKGYFWNELHVGYVTNGVHMPTWAASEWKEFYEETFGPKLLTDQSNPELWEKIFNVDDEKIWNLRMALKNKFVNYIKVDFRETWLKNQGDPSRIVSIMDQINPNALIIGFARRFATYKRAHLLFTDLDRLSRIVNNPDRPVQFVFSGKAHPADGGGQGLIKKIIDISRQPEFLGKIIFLENYDMNVARRLVSGVDIWLNTPTRPLEASGTSGEKAEMNGVLNFSVLDGWWYEGYKHGAGWSLTDKRTYQDQGHQDQLDAATIYTMLENEIIPLYFDKNQKGFSPEWIQYIKKSIASIAPHFTMKRMLDDYIARFYSKQNRRAQMLKADDFKIAKELVVWKEEVASKWDQIEVASVELPEGLYTHSTVGQEYLLKVALDRKTLDDCIGVELVITSNESGLMTAENVVEMKSVKTEGSMTYYEMSYSPTRAGSFKYAFRMFPKNDLLPHRQDFCYVRWF